MTIYPFYIPLPEGMPKPKPQPRPRARAIVLGVGGVMRAAATKNPKAIRDAIQKSVRAQSYPKADPELKRYRDAIRAAIPDDLRGAKHDGVVSIYIRLQYERPKSHLNAAGEVKTAPKYKSPAPVAPMSASDGDWDNLAKPICDVLQEEGVYTDDALITDPQGPIKRYAPAGMPGGVYVAIGLLDELPDEWPGLPALCPCGRELHEGATRWAR